VLELLDLTRVNDKEDLRQELDRMIKSNKLKDAEVNKLKLDYIFRFTQSSVAARMRKAQADGKLYKEKQFVMGIQANEVVKDQDSDELILIQGIIDAFFEEEGEYVLLDYKSDIVENEELLVKRYEVQLLYYKRALEQILKKRVKEMIIYSLYLGKEIRIE
jgi:ATP-dependent helicase/nuclease subunit A